MIETILSVRVLIILLSAIIALIIGYTFFSWFFSRKKTSIDRVTSTESTGGRTKKKMTLQDMISNWADGLSKINSKVKSPFFQNYIRSYKQKLDMAGNPIGMTPEKFFAQKELFAVGALLFYIFILVLLLEMMKFSILWLIVFPIVGFFWPDFQLKGKIDKRQKDIFRALPDTLDLLTLSVEAGLDFSGALNVIIKRGRASALKDEIIQMDREVKMGKTRIDGLRAMADRNQMIDLTSFCSAIIQALKMGSSLGPILRIQSDQLRTKREQLAEKLAAQAPVKMLGPLIICIFPTVFIMLFAPIIMSVMKMK